MTYKVTEDNKNKLAYLKISEPADISDHVHARHELLKVCSSNNYNRAIVDLSLCDMDKMVSEGQSKAFSKFWREEYKDNFSLAVILAHLNDDSIIAKLTIENTKKATVNIELFYSKTSALEWLNSHEK